MDNKFDDNDIFKKFYVKYKSIIDKKLSRIIINIFEHNTINYNGVYVLTLRDKYQIKNDIYDYTSQRLKGGIRHSYIINESKFLIFNEVCKKILSEHYKTIPVCNFGFNKSFCFDYKKFDTSINIYFKLLE
jgi:hypothetical protein